LLQPQMLAIMGPPKCGKSTLLSLTAGRGGTRGIDHAPAYVQPSSAHARCFRLQAT
jgi:ABC-type nitrate/sulfonate/bicarbonate transport system ATPase subunit